MRIGRRGAMAMAATLGLMVAAFSVPAAASGAAAPVGTEPATGAFLFQGSSAKGLVTLTQQGAAATLRFHLFGLKPDRQYRLIGSTKGCGSSKGVAFTRTFKTNPKGVAWDPVTYTIDATTVASVRIRNAVTGAQVACVGTPEIAVTSTAIAVKMRTGSIRGLIAESEPTIGSWVVAATFTGLIANGDYWMYGRTGTCEAPAGGVWSRSVEANGSGRALELYYASPQAFPATIIELKPAAASDEEDPALICRQIRQP